MRARAQLSLILTTSLACAACSIDLSGLQRKDSGFNPAIDPDASTAGAGGNDEGQAGSSGEAGSSGASSAGASGQATAGESGSGGAGSGGTGGAGAIALPIAGATSTAGQTSMPIAGMSAPPPAAGAPAAGSAAPEPTDSGLPPRTCGLPGLPCCNPGNMCDLGACLRGKCTPYGGFYARTAACAINPCGSRNAYTAGCNCPTGFNDTLLWQETEACEGDAGDTGVTEAHSCTAGRVPDIAFGGAWVEGPDDSCTVACQTPNPLTGACTCPARTERVAMTVDIPETSCPDTAVTLQVCIDSDGAPVNFGGAYAVSQSAPLGCGAANPLTAACSCPPEVTMPQSLHVGSWSIFVCNL